jgi:YVTN family beta-propeller protein
VANGDPGLAVTPDTVSVINTATNMEITQVDLTDGAITDPGPGRVAVTPDGSLAYVTGRFDDVVQVISTATNTLVMTITDTSFNHPLGLAITPDGRFAYVGNRMGGTVSVLDLSSNTVTTAITVGTGPHDIAITPDGRFAYVPNKNSDDVSVIDLATNTVVTTITIGNDPHGAAVTPDGAFVYISYDGGAEVRVIDTSTNAEIGAGSPIPFGAPGGLRQIAAIQNPSLNIPTDTLPAATVGSAYSFSVAAGGGTPPRTFTIDAAGAAALAAHGLAFNSAGLISSGSVTGPAATLMLNVTVTDSSTPATSVTKTVTLQIM